MSNLVVFLDDGGVMNDNNLRGRQWQILVAEFFAPILGGSASAWEEANRVVAELLLAPNAWPPRLELAPDYLTFDRKYQLDWLRGMCELVDVPMPAEEESLSLAQQATLYVTRRVKSAFPGAVEAIRTLRSRGYLLHTASGESSTDLTGYLEGMGVRDCFGRLYGPDLTNTFKDGPAYYTRLLDDSGVPPGSALVVDDSPRVLAWAASLGAKTVLVSTAGRVGVEGTVVIGSLRELPEVVDRLQPSDRRASSS